MRQNIIEDPIADRPRVVTKRLAVTGERGKAEAPDRVRWFILWVVGAAICFGPSLLALLRYAWSSELYSYTLVIPLISLYLAWPKEPSTPLDSGRLYRFAVFPLVAAFGTLGCYWWRVQLGWHPTLNDYLAFSILSFLCFVTAGCFLFLCKATLRRAGFGIAFLIFMVPLPDVVRSWLESFLQHRSADVAQVLFALTGMPALRHETIFHLPGFTLEVAPECSGIHSSLVLFITSLVAGYVFLQRPWGRALLTLAVLPLALLRNGFRIVTIGTLCVRVSPDMINSYIHRRGGPIFFVLSLIPFFFLLLYLRRAERKRRCSPIG